MKNIRQKSTGLGNGIPRPVLTTLGTVSAKKGKKKRLNHEEVRASRNHPSRNSATSGSQITADNFAIDVPEYVTFESNEKRSFNPMLTIDVVEEASFGSQVGTFECSNRIGTWNSSTKAEDIESYLLTCQRKFVKYRLNIFYLNRCALRIQHWFFRSKRMQLRDNSQQQRQNWVGKFTSSWDKNDEGAGNDLSSQVVMKDLNSASFNRRHLYDVEDQEAQIFKRRKSSISDHEGHVQMISEAYQEQPYSNCQSERVEGADQQTPKFRVINNAQLFLEEIEHAEPDSCEEYHLEEPDQCQFSQTLQEDFNQNQSPRVISVQETYTTCTPDEHVFYAGQQIPHEYEPNTAKNTNSTRLAKKIQLKSLPDTNKEIAQEELLQSNRLDNFATPKVFDKVYEMRKSRCHSDHIQQIIQRQQTVLGQKNATRDTQFQFRPPSQAKQQKRTTAVQPVKKKPVNPSIALTKRFISDSPTNLKSQQQLQVVHQRSAAPPVSVSSQKSTDLLHQQIEQDVARCDSLSNRKSPLPVIEDEIKQNKTQFASKVQLRRHHLNNIVQRSSDEKPPKSSQFSSSKKMQTIIHVDLGQNVSPCRPIRTPKHEIQSQNKRISTGSIGVRHQTRTDSSESYQRVPRDYQQRSSLSHRSVHSTFSSEQKQVRKFNLKQNLISRVQDKPLRQNKPLFKNTAGTHQGSPRLQKQKMETRQIPLQTRTDEEKRLLREKQLAAMQRLAQQTVSSRAKSRPVSKSTERVEQDERAQHQDSKANRNLNYSSQQYEASDKHSCNKSALKSPSESGSMPYLNSTTYTFDSQPTSNTNHQKRFFRQQQSTAAAQPSRNSSQKRLQMAANAKPNKKVVTTITTTTKYYINGKETKTTVQKTTKQGQQQKTKEPTPRNSSTKAVNQSTLNNTTTIRRKSSPKVPQNLLSKQRRVFNSNLRGNAIPSNTTSRSRQRNDSWKDSTTRSAETLKGVKDLTLDRISKQQIIKLPNQNIRQSYTRLSRNSQINEAAKTTDNTVPNQDLYLLQSSFMEEVPTTARKRELEQRNPYEEIKIAKVEHLPDSNSAKSLSNISSRGIPQASLARAEKRKQRIEERQHKLGVISNSVYQPDSKYLQSRQSISQHQQFISASTRQPNLRTKHQKAANLLHHKKNESQPQPQQPTNSKMSTQKEEIIAPLQMFQKPEKEGTFNEYNQSIQTRTCTLTASKKQSDLMSGDSLSSNLEREEPNSACKNTRTSGGKNHNFTGQPSQHKTEVLPQQKKSLLQPLFANEETKINVQKCFTQDIAYSKLERVFTTESKQILEVLQANYIGLYSIYSFYAGQSEFFPVMAVEDLVMFCNDSGLLAKGSSVSEAAIMKCFSQIIVTSATYKKSGLKVLNRYEFIELLVFIAATINRDSHGEGVCATLKALLANQILPKARKTARQTFCCLLGKDPRVVELLSQNELVLQTAFNYLCDGDRPMVPMNQCYDLAHRCQLDTSEKLFGVVFAESLSPVVDTVNDKDRMLELSFTEFTYLICRLIDMHYADTEDEVEQLWKKLDRMLPFIFQQLDLRPQFSYGVQFASDVKRDPISFRDLNPEQPQKVIVRSQQLSPVNKCHEKKESISGVRTQDEFKKATLVDEHGEFIYDMTMFAKDQIGNTETFPQTDISFDQYHDGDIQAWPQPCPSAYPQRKEMISPRDEIDLIEETGATDFSFPDKAAEMQTFIYHHNKQQSRTCLQQCLPVSQSEPITRKTLKTQQRPSRVNEQRSLY